MRLPFLLPLGLIVAASCSVVKADTLPVGTYSLSAQTTTTGIHQSQDQGTLSGTLVFSASSVLTFANLVFNDTTDGLAFTFTVPGVTTYTPAAHLLDAIVYNAGNPNIRYYFSVSTNTTLSTFRLTCGTDCFTDAIIPDSTGRSTLNEELGGNITPTTVTPEPSSLLLLGTGVLAAASTVRRKAALA